MKNYRFRTLLACVAFSLSLSCCEKDEEIVGCVYGKVIGVKAEFRIGCMSKAQFYRYLESPSFDINGTIVNRDLRFVRVDDCLQCN